MLYNGHLLLILGTTHIWFIYIISDDVKAEITSSRGGQSACNPFKLVLGGGYTTALTFVAFSYVFITIFMHPGF
jgi:hypothetical protein